MSSRAPLLGAVAALSLFAGVTGVRPAYMLAYGLALTLLIAAAWSFLVARGLRVTRESPEGSYTVGAPFSERFRVSNHGRLPVAYCEVRDTSTLIGYNPGRVCALGGRDSVRWVEGGVFSHRGRHSLGPLEARFGDPFGLFPRTIRVVPEHSVIVYPRLHEIDDLGASRRGGPIGGTGLGHVIDAPPDVATVREYRPEDGFGRIHWRSTARRGRLMSRSYDTRASADILVVLDLQAGVHAGTAPESSLEYAVSLAASVCDSALRRGQAVGLITNDRAATAFPAGRGAIHRLRILEYLAVTAADGTRPVADAIQRHAAGARARGGMVVITASHDRTWIEAVLDGGVPGRRHLVILVDPASFGGPVSPFEPPAAWRAALDWWVVRRGDGLGRPSPAGTDSP